MRENIFAEIGRERQAQDEKWGGPAHDDKHTSYDWIAYLVRHTGKAVCWPWDAQVFRRQMVRVAALAVAAIEWVDRAQAKQVRESVDHISGEGILQDPSRD